MSSVTIESRVEQIAHADREMGTRLDRYEKMAHTIRKRRPLEVGYYKWGEVQPDLVHPAVIAALRFVSHVERPPHKYAEPILRAADNGGVSSLRRFIERTWLPEEKKHGVLLRQAAISYGAVSEKEHDRELAAIDRLDFPIGRGYTAGMAATYGWAQELITHLFYTAMLHHTKDPVLKMVLGDLASQEMFHSGVYRGFRESFATPQDIIRAICKFQMPGHVTSPELQKQSTGWAHTLGFDFRRMQQSLATGIVEQAGYQGLGRVISSALIRNEFPLPLRLSLLLADRIHNPLIDTLGGKIAARTAGVKSKTA